VIIGPGTARRDRLVAPAGKGPAKAPGQRLLDDAWLGGQEKTLP
jgi:hypothetical protein